MDMKTSLLALLNDPSLPKTDALIGHALPGPFFEPTVVTEATADMLCAREETFGGVQQSGLGREASHHRMDDYVELKFLYIGAVLK